MDARSPELARARYMYVTTYSQAGKPGTVPTWLWPHEDAVYFTTKRDSVKARRIRNLTDNSEKPLGEWNTMVIEAAGRSIKVWVNGDLVNEGSDATADRGRIALQSEGSEVEFRKLSLSPISTQTITHSKGSRR